MPIPGIYASQISGHLSVPVGAYDALASVTLSAATATVTFAGIPTGYKHLQLRMLIQGSTTSFWTSIQFNGDTGSTYSRHELRGDSSTTVSATGAGTQPNIRLALQENSSSYWTAGITDILDYGNAYKYKTVRSLAGNDKNGTSVSPIVMTSGSWQSIAPITSLTLFSEQGGNLNTYSQFALYGVK